MNRRRVRRQSSNIFTAFTQAQIAEFKEIFNLLDSTADGNISREDLSTFLESIGSPLTEEEINTMMEEMGDRFNFTLFLTVLCERLSNLDSENVIARALKVFDPNDTGSVSLFALKEALLAQEPACTKEEWAALEKLLTPVEGKAQIADVAKLIRHCGLSQE
ncbi:myosin regulatory light chain 12 [Nematocida sp. AWRm77]|nr:myosin regulatory light chain 12 [Nematocida sp. AWRm77]